MKNMIFLCFILLTGCQVLPVNEPAQKNYDLGLLPNLKSMPLTASVVEVPELNAADWLQTRSMYYRFAYDDPAQIRHYALSSWISPPAQLLGPLVRDGLSKDTIIVSDKTGYQARWALFLTLTDFEQVFISPNQSYGRVTMNAILMRLSDHVVMARESFSQETAALGNNAEGGVKALSEASSQLVKHLGVWLMQKTQAENSKS